MVLSNTLIGWAYYAHNPGYKYHQSSAEVYGESYGAGDIIGVTLDMNAGTLSFSKNGTEIGVAYSTELLGKKLYPAVSLLEPEDSVTFRNYSNVSVKKGDSSTIDSICPLRFHRVGLMLCYSADLTMNEMARELSQDKSMQMSWPSHSSLLDHQVSIEELTKELQSSIIDLNYELVTFSTTSPSQNSSKNKRIFQEFSKQGGLSKLVSVLYTQLEEQGIYTINSYLKKYKN